MVVFEVSGNSLRKVCISWDSSRLVELRNSRGTETTSATC